MGRSLGNADFMSAIATYLFMHRQADSEFPCEGAEYGVCGGAPHTEDCPSHHKKRSGRRISPRTWKRVHWTLTVVWALMLIPTLLWWSDSILWVAGMSLYANVAGHWAAAQAAEADEHSPDE